MPQSYESIDHTSRVSVKVATMTHEGQVRAALTSARGSRGGADTGRGTLAHIDPPMRLVVHGLYRYVRNPMYVGGLVLLLSEALAFRSMANLGWAVLWFAAINCVVVFYEEPVLQSQFGEADERYGSVVSRWWPGRRYRGAA